MTSLPTCETCGQPIRLIQTTATSTAPEVWLHVERQPWHGNQYDWTAHNATPREPSWTDEPLPGL